MLYFICKKERIRPLSFFTAVLLLLSACTFSVNTGSPKVHTGYNLDKDTRSEVHKLARRVFKSIQQQDSRNIARMFYGNNKPYDTIASILKNIVIPDGPPVMNTVGEYHIVNNIGGAINEVSSSIGENDFTYHFTPYTTESYVYLFYTPLKDEDADILVSLEFNKNNEKWYLTNLNFGLFLYKNMLAPKLAYSALNKYLDNQMIAAAFETSLTHEMSFPAGNRFRYADEENVMNILKEISAEYNDKFAFPQTVIAIESNPVITGLRASNNKGRLIVDITYLSNLTTSPIKLKEELAELHLLRELLFPGIASYGDSINYTIAPVTDVSKTLYYTYKLSNDEAFLSEKEYMKKYVYPLLPDSTRQKLDKLNTQ